MSLPEDYFLAEADDGTRVLCEDIPVYRIAPQGVEPLVEYPVRRVARIPKGTLLSDIRELARLDKRSRDMTGAPVERQEALVSLAERFGA